MRGLLAITLATTALCGCGSEGQSQSEPDSRPATPLTQELLPASQFQIISPVPESIAASYRLDRDYYSKYIDVWGIPILGPAEVNDTLMKNAAEILAYQLSDANLQEGLQPQIRQRLYQQHFRVVIYPRSYGSYGSQSVPEYRDFPDSPGYGATPELPMLGVSSSRLDYAENREYPYDGNSLIHEITHSIHLLALNKLMPEFEEQLKQAYNQAMADELWRESGFGYIRTNFKEYLAVGSELWNDVRASEALTSREYGTSLRQHLHDTDPALYNLLDGIYSGDYRMRDKLTVYQGFHTLTFQLMEADYPQAIDLNNIRVTLESDGLPFTISKINDERLRKQLAGKYSFGFSSRSPEYDYDYDVFLPRLDLDHPDYVKERYRLQLSQGELTLADCTFSRADLLANSNDGHSITVGDSRTCRLQAPTP